MGSISAADTVWVLVSAALVLFMTPGLALFYGGLVRARGVLSIMLQSFMSIAVVGVAWALFGYSLAFGRDAGAGLIGNLGLAGMTKQSQSVPGFAHLAISSQTFGVFQMMFAVITAALVTGGGADRMRPWAFALFVLVWSALVYDPIAHWVFSPLGWLGSRGVMDFAGGTVVEINSGFSALGLALALGRRRGWPQEPMLPHSVPLAVAGAGILWFGWFGFNAGSAGAINSVAVQAFLNTQLAAATGLLGWLGIEALRTRKATMVGAVSGAVAGMVAITPAAGFVGTLPALGIGLLAGLLCPLAVAIKFRFRYDDSLDVLAVHGVGGVIGTLCVGLFAAHAIDPAGSNGLASGGGWHLLGVQAMAVASTAAYATLATYLIAKLMMRWPGLRARPDEEAIGLDETLQAEIAYSGIGHTGR
jgi:Amt family ammonium transporter